MTTEYSGAEIGGLVGDDGSGGDGLGPLYVYRLRQPCGLVEERGDVCNALDFQACPADPGRVVEYLTVQQRPVVRTDGTAAVEMPAGAQPGDLLEDWIDLRTECLDITALNPPPSPEEVFSYFQRLPLPQLTTRHAPPGAGLSGLPVVFWTDSPTTQTFTVDIRGFTVVIAAEAQQYTWRTGDPAMPTLTSTEPGAPYPDQAAEHLYRSGTYTAGLTVTWGATFTVDGSAPADVPGTTTTNGPPVTFDVVEATAVLTNPYD
ncbi:hypothetical protein SAMN05660464_0053 [Geodermatophilus dictyosporus]|uniref:PKD domain-containing protein n=1 Tax=Geodermatophilus dictyosporus TaxID=1523247 RepID=A0A1I5U3N0_9ACTN|nr:hypothetical protein [Geodermatophilus dictyosporus]SFP89892.1 hypothetical protein SAMN05660464_0053 [Geodermatophilus dictyosporus]